MSSTTKAGTMESGFLFYIMLTISTKYSIGNSIGMRLNYTIMDRGVGKRNRRRIQERAVKEKRDESILVLLEMLEGAKSIGAGAATIASAGAAVGIGNVLSSSINSVARNPSLAKQLFGYAILGFALTEAIASFALMMAFLISFVFRSQKQCLW
ncbi:unnamed protein product (mitochondrion) [Musa acuminata var. zebrina]